MDLNDVLKYFQENEVRCKIVKDDRPEYGDFIAVFTYGKLTRKEIADVIRENDLSCMFFEGSIREDEYRKRQIAKQVVS